MKAVILCAGYATRLYPLTKNKPKALLEVRGKPILSHIIEKIPKEVSDVIVVSNDLFYSNFVKWKNENSFDKNIKILNDFTKTNETRLGGVGDLWLAIKEENINEDLLVILGDNFFEFKLDEIQEFFLNKKSCVVGLYDLEDLEKSKKFGVLEIDKNNKIVSFVEKPKKPVSSLISTGIYFFRRNEIKDIEDYMKTKESKEGPGFLIPYLMKKKEIYGFIFRGVWHDIGSMETYREVNK